MTTESLPLGKKVCNVPGYEACFVQWKVSGYPRRLHKEWTNADGDGVLQLVLRYVSAWELHDIDGLAVEPTADIACLDNVEEAVVLWLVRTFAEFWLRELLLPRPNS